jgi:hypothetical protein
LAGKQTLHRYALPWPKIKTSPPAAVSTGKVTVEELIRGQLQGKSSALERYDAIL